MAAGRQVFTSSGTFTPPAGVSTVAVLVVGAGGGGGRAGSSGGGGGGGQVRHETAVAVSGAVTVTVGAGGAGRTGSTGAGTAGGASAFGAITAAGGGGGGGGGSAPATSGASGGGGAAVAGAGGAGGAATAGFAGGAGINPATLIGCGGGGGAGGIGASATDGVGGAGGAGSNRAGLVGTDVGVAGVLGGGGGGGTRGPARATGAAGGGLGGSASTAASAAAPNTGSGGGGAGATIDGTTIGEGMAGGSGVVVVMWDGWTPPGIMPILNRVRLGAPTDTMAHAVSTTSSASSVRLRVAHDEAMTTGLVHGAAFTPDAQGYAHPTVTGLPPDSEWWYQVGMTAGGEEYFSPARGPFRTAPVPGSPKSFAFTIGGDLDNGSTDPYPFDAMLASDPAFVVSTGDLFTNEPTDTTQAHFRARLEHQWDSNPALAALTANRPFLATRSDGDGSNDNNGAPGAYTAALNAAWRQAIAFPELPLAPGCTAWKVQWGRVLIIGLDTTSQRSVTEPYRKLSAEQRAWLEEQLADPAPLKLIVQEGTWINSAAPKPPPDGDAWADYWQERAELGALFEAAPGTVALFEGDGHSLHADDGTNNPHGRFPTMGCSPFGADSSQKGGPWTQGPYPTAPDVLVRQFARVEILDDGGDITVKFTGYDSTNTARVAMTFSTSDVEPPEVITGAAVVGDRWIKGTMRAAFWNEATGKYSAIVPVGAAGHRWVPDLDTRALGAVVDARSAARCTVVHEAGTSYVLRAHTSSSLFSVYDPAGTQVVAGASVPLSAANLDASPITLHRTPNGHLWAAVLDGAGIKVSRSTNDGATWSAPVTVVAVATTGAVALATAGTTLVLVATGNDSSGRWVRTIGQAAASIATAAWSSESLPALPSGLTSDDHLSMIALPDGRLIAATKTTGSTTGAQPLLYSLIRSRAGAWTMQPFEGGPDDIGWTRPVLTRVGTDVVVVYGSYAAGRDLVTRRTPIDALGTWSARTMLVAGPDWTDGATIPDERSLAAATRDVYPVLAHRWDTGQVLLLWRPTGQTAPGGATGVFVGDVPITGIYLGEIPITGLFVGSTPIFT